MAVIHCQTKLQIGCHRTEAEIALRIEIAVRTIHHGLNVTSTIAHIGHIDMHVSAQSPCVPIAVADEYPVPQP